VSSTGVLHGCPLGVSSWGCPLGMSYRVVLQKCPPGCTLRVFPGCPTGCHPELSSGVFSRGVIQGVLHDVLHGGPTGCPPGCTSGVSSKAFFRGVLQEFLPGMIPSTVYLLNENLIHSFQTCSMTIILKLSPNQCRFRQEWSTKQLLPSTNQPCCSSPVTTGWQSNAVRVS
jgi:hypothetical protein